MDKKYIDLFFDKGIIRVSSFKKFRNYPDEIRGDKAEGSGSYHTLTKEETQFILMTSVGNNEYMLSTSLIQSESIQKIFNVDSCFKIIKPLEFSIAISNAILGVNQINLGLCNYQDTRSIRKKIENFSINDFTDEKKNLIIGGPKMNQRIDEIAGNATDLLYLKGNNYQNQAEFRFVWSIDSRYFRMHEYLDLEAKEALQFCERVEVKQSE